MTCISTMPIPYLFFSSDSQIAAICSLGSYILDNIKINLKWFTFYCENNNLFYGRRIYIFIFYGYSLYTVEYYHFITGSLICYEKQKQQHIFNSSYILHFLDKRKGREELLQWSLTSGCLDYKFLSTERSRGATFRLSPTGTKHPFSIPAGLGKSEGK